MRTLLIAALALLLLPAGLQAAPEAASARIVSHDLTVRFDPPRHRMVAKDVMTVRGGGEAANVAVRLAKTLTLSKATLGGEPVALSRTEDGALQIPAPGSGTHEVTLWYAGEIADAVEKSDDLTWVVGDNTSGFIGAQGIYLSDASRWVPLPVQRTPARFNVNTVVPEPFVVVTQGGPVVRTTITTRGFDASSDELLPKDKGSGDEAKWSRAFNPATIPTDGLSLSAGPYVQKSRDVEGVKLSTFFYRRHAKHADVWLDAGEETIRRYAKLLGPLPHTKFDIVENFFQSGYGMPAYTLLGDRVIDYVTAKARRYGGKIPPGYLDHEYVHCWFGNGLFVDYASGNWCEALTTYYSNYLAREIESESEARAYRRGVLEKFAIRVKGEADYPLRKFVTKTEDADNDVGYGKGAMFFHMLRKRVGDKAFFDGVRAFTSRHMGTIVTWDDWLDAFDRDGAATALRPFLERKGVPDVRVAVTQKGAAPDGGTLVVAKITSTDESGAVWPTTVPVRVTYRDKGGANRALDSDVVVRDGPAVLDVVVPGSPTAVEVDPDYDMLRRIEPDALPHCLNRTLESEGEKALVVDAPEGMLDALANRIGRGKGFVRKPADFDWKTHDGPVVVLKVLAKKPDGGMDVGDEHYDDATVSVLRSYGSEHGPRTVYLALSPNAASRAGYMTYYGWDSWVTFHNGIPRDRRTWREPPSTRLVLQDEGAAAKRAADWVKALSATPRAPGQRNELVEKQLEEALSVLEPLAIETKFHMQAQFRVKKAAVHYVLGSHQGSLTGPYVRPLCFSGSGETRWQHRNVFSVRYDAKSEKPLSLFKRIRARARNGALVLVDKPSWDRLAPWLDAMDDLTEASKAELARPGRDGKPRARPASLEAWITGRRARGGLPSPPSLSFPVLCVRDDVWPIKASNGSGPIGAMEELSLDVQVQTTSRKARNLVAWKPPTNWTPAPGIRTPVVVLCAHYDSLPWLDVQRFPGADDNASGVACVLAVARNLAKGAGAPNLGVVVALTDAEEWGLYGARALQRALSGQYDVRAVINVDSIGRAVSKPCHVIGHSTYPPLARRIQRALMTEGIELGADIDRYAYAHGSDHYAFHQKGIPSVSLWASDYNVMNTWRDTADKVETDGIARIARALTTLIQSDLAWILGMK